MELAILTYCAKHRNYTHSLCTVFSHSPKQFLSPSSSLFPSPLRELTFGVNELINEQHGSAKREPRAAIMRANKGRRLARNEPCHLALTKFAYNTGSSERKHSKACPENGYFDEKYFGLQARCWTHTSGIRSSGWNSQGGTSSGWGAFRGSYCV